MATRLVCEKEKCCACGACVNVCPKQCIELVDNVRNTYAKVNEDLCINCHLCEKVCQIYNSTNQILKFNEPISCEEGISKNNEVIKASSSGGFATQLGIKFSQIGGYVVGVKSDKDDFYFDVTNKSNDIFKFSGSKYVKISTGDIFKKVKKLLNSGEKVLFFGTPCQIAAMKMYMLKPFDNLYTVDLICHGTPSIKVLDKYLEQDNRYTKRNLKFRTKEHGIEFALSNDVRKNRLSDPYTIGFLKGLYYTENCYSCRYARRERISDITIGDSWGSKKENLKGALSIVLTSTEKGNELLNLVKDSFELVTCDYENAIAHNHQLSHPSWKQKYTDFFFDNFENINMKKIIKKAYPKSFYKQQLKKILIAFRLK